MSDNPLDILPFRFLDDAGRDYAAKHLTQQAYPNGAVVVRRGDRADRRIFLLLEGEVDAFDAHDRWISRVDAGHYFGERAALFDLPRMLEIRARGAIRVAAMPGQAFLQLLADQPAFAQALGMRLRDKQGIFVAFDRFLAELKVGATKGYLVIPKLLHLYRPLLPALHRKALDPELDLGALSYAVGRLPANIGQTLALLLADDVPNRYSGAQTGFRAIPTAARRRTVYELMPGKSMVVLRDGWSDLVDLITCLCIFSVEARKIRHRVSDPARLRALLDDTPGAFDGIPFTDEERAGLARIFPDLRQTLIRMAVHHEDFAISILKSVDHYDSAHSEQWTDQLAEATRRLTGHDPRQLPADFAVHVISSNTHSVGNCLSSWLFDHREAIEAWGTEHRPELFEQDWKEPTDRLVALARDYLQAHPDQAAARDEVDAHPGVVDLEQTALTGIGVQLFDLGSLAGRTMDPALPPVPAGSTGMILNIDYAFGQQAETILASIVALFGPRIRSINILGKAGGLEGRRGDVMVATRFLEQEDDGLHVPRSAVDTERLRARLPDRLVLEGPVLTVVGTVIQNQVMLNFYRRIWGCVGLEMEGSYYCRQILESQALGALPADVDLRFLYYISDLPLHAEATLSGSMRSLEGIPPLYAVTREVLTAIFEGAVSSAG